MSIPKRSDDQSKADLDASVLRLPPSLSTAHIRAGKYRRFLDGAFSIDGAVITAERDAFRALGLVFLAYALSSQEDEFRLALADRVDELSQVVIWPSDPSRLESDLGIRQQISRISYQAKLPRDNPSYLTTEQDRKKYPREHLPVFQLGSLDVMGGDVVRDGKSACAHFEGTGPSLVWLGKYLLNFALEDCNATLAYLYNLDPAESMGWGSGELRLTVRDPSDGPQLWPEDFAENPPGSESGEGNSR